MTNADHELSSAPDDVLLIVEAFIDGELVDPAALRDALAQPEAREHLAELLAIREAVSATTPRAWSVIERKASPVRRGVRWLAVAAGVVLSLTTGYFAGHEAAQAAPAATSTTVEILMGGAAPPPLPDATRVIPLRPGINWTETSGGR
jgi:hypothetical protein